METLRYNQILDYRLRRNILSVECINAPCRFIQIP
jgi:hypothetical protein